MLRVKGMDGYCPIGPGLVSGVDVRKATLRSYRNGKMVQDGAISEHVEVPAPRAAVGFPASLDSDGVRRVALGNEERLPDKFKTTV